MTTPPPDAGAPTPPPTKLRQTRIELGDGTEMLVSKMRHGQSPSSYSAESYAPPAASEYGAAAGASTYAASPYTAPQTQSGPMGAIMQSRKVPIPGVGSFETSIFSLSMVFGVFG